MYDNSNRKGAVLCIDSTVTHKDKVRMNGYKFMGHAKVLSSSFIVQINGKVELNLIIPNIDFIALKSHLL